MEVQFPKIIFEFEGDGPLTLRGIGDIDLGAAEMKAISSIQKIATLELGKLRAMGYNFFGSISLICESGKVVRVKTERTFKVEELTK